jgi:hypothetical protein
MRQVATAPRFYRESLTVGLRAVLYRKDESAPRTAASKADPRTGPVR